MNEWGEPSEQDIEREFPGWQLSRSFGWRVATRRDDPGVRVRGEDLMDLRDEIRRAEALDQR